MHEVAGFPVRYPSLDILTIGAGGGSIARLDPGGALVVGPESAGAVPGPRVRTASAGTEPTVTDADLVLGRIPAGTEFPGLGRLDVDAARTAIDAAGLTADGIVRVVDANMERAVRVVTVERGVDARELALVAFGGAGPLHACAVADALGMRAVIVPPRAGVLSAVGLVSAPPQRELVRSWPDPADHAGVAAGACGARGARWPRSTGSRATPSRSRRSSTAGTPGRATSSRSRRSTSSRPSTRGATATRDRASRSRSSRIRARARGAAPLDPAELPAWPRDARRRPGRRRRTRLHRLGPRRLDRRPRRAPDRQPGSCTREHGADGE